jgi:hypothetical protein
MKAEKPFIELWNFKGLGLIIEHPTGVIYTNQTGGHSCKHPELEGAFYPLFDRPGSQQTELDHIFLSEKWRGWCDSGIDAETADCIDIILASSLLTRHLKVDRDRLTESWEAWIHVMFEPKNKYDESPLYFGFSSGKGVLTWENSD